MAIKINNTTISPGNKVNYNDVQKTKVNYNGNEVYVYDTTGHQAELSDSLIKNISTNHTHNHNHGKDWNNSAQVYKYYIESETRGTYTGEGLWAEATATYNATIDLTILPNYEYIKRVVVGRYGYGATTINIEENQTSVPVSDYDKAEDRNSYFPHGPGERWGVSAKAGISSVTYYYV